MLVIKILTNMMTKATKLSRTGVIQMVALIVKVFPNITTKGI